jgi:hypothetical protein
MEIPLAFVGMGVNYKIPCRNLQNQPTEKVLQIGTIGARCMPTGVFGVKSLLEGFKKCGNIISRLHDEMTPFQTAMYISPTLLFFHEAHDWKRRDYVVSFLAVMGDDPSSFERGGR